MGTQIKYKIVVIFWENGNPVRIESGRLKDDPDRYFKIRDSIKRGNLDSLTFEGTFGETLIINRDLLRRSVIEIWELSEKG